MQKTLTTWIHGIRLYIAGGIFLVTLETWWWAHATYAGSILQPTRLEEAYAWYALTLLFIAVSIGPLYKLFPRLPAASMLRDARRMIGIGAAWFGSLHATIAYVELFKNANPLHLPAEYQRAFVLGVIALVILLAMAFTSFDRAFKGMGIWWFRLHRLVYLAVIVALLHAFMIGVHATTWTVLIILTAATASLLISHFYLDLIRNAKPSWWQLLTISYAFLLLVAVFNYGYGQRLGYNPIEGKHAHHQP